MRLHLDSGVKMGTTYDALKRAEWGSQRRRPITLLEPREEEIRPRRDAAATDKMVVDHGDIKNNLLGLVAEGSTKRLLLVNTFEGGESADCVARFAASLTEDSDLGVLVVDLNPWILSLGEVLSTDHTLGLLDLFSQGAHTHPQIEKVGPGELYKARLGGDHAKLSELLESGSFDRFLDSTNEQFDFVIFNMPGGVGFQECRAVCAKVDAAALILPPGASADQIALSAQKYIENPADKLLGVIVDQAKPSRRIRLEVVRTVIAICVAFGLGFLVGDLLTGPARRPACSPRKRCRGRSAHRSPDARKNHPGAATGSAGKDSGDTRIRPGSTGSGHLQARKQRRSSSEHRDSSEGSSGRESFGHRHPGRRNSREGGPDRQGHTGSNRSRASAHGSRRGRGQSLPDHYWSLRSLRQGTA